jgi:branched-chain amino acid transport system ATP-binding protein
VVVEQSLNVALSLADRAYFLEKGSVRFSGPTAELLERDDIVRSVFLAGAQAAPGAQAPDGQAPPGASAGRAGPDGGRARGARGPQVVRRGARRAGRDAAGRPGEIVGLVGGNGAGKTTLFDLVSASSCRTAGACSSAART